MRSSLGDGFFQERARGIEFIPRQDETQGIMLRRGARLRLERLLQVARQIEVAVMNAAQRLPGA